MMLTSGGFVLFSLRNYCVGRDTMAGDFGRFHKIIVAFRRLAVLIMGLTASF